MAIYRGKIIFLRKNPNKKQTRGGIRIFKCSGGLISELRRAEHLWSRATLILVLWRDYEICLLILKQLTQSYQKCQLLAFGRLTRAFEIRSKNTHFCSEPIVWRHYITFIWQLKLFKVNTIWAERVFTIVVNYTLPSDMVEINEATERIFFFKNRILVKK